MPYMPNAQIVRGLTGPTGATGATGATGPAGLQGSALLLSSTSVGGTSIDLDRTPPAGWVAGNFLVISRYTSRAEIVTIASVSGSTITVTAVTSSGMKTAHTAGDTVTLIESNYVVSPTEYGCTPGSSDSWAAIQRLMIEATAFGLKIGYTNAVAGAYAFQVSQPVICPPGSQFDNVYLKARAGYAPADPDGALAMVPVRYFPVTASAATNTFTTVSGVTGMGGSGSFSEVNHTKVAFNAPYGESLPGGITAGKVYFINTTPTTSTFTVSATQGGAILDITSDGTAYAYTDIAELARTYWDNVRFDVTVADVNCLLVNLQQPAYIRNIRVHQQATNTVDVYGAQIGGQIGYISNFMGVASDTPHVTMLYLWGTGITVDNVNIQGGTGIEVAGDAISIHNPWTEVCDVGILITSGRGTTISGSWLNAPSDLTYIALKCNSLEATFNCGQIYNSSGGAMILYNDPNRAITLYGIGAADPASVATTYHSVFAGITQKEYVAGFNAVPPTLHDRMTVPVSANWTVRYMDEAILVNSTGASRTISLPAANPWQGYTYTVAHIAGANTCTVDTTGSETIDGGASTTVTLGTSKTFMSDGTNYFTMS